MGTRPTRTVDIPVLRDLMERLLRAAGCDAENAAIAAGVFVEADMRGVGLQGLDHMHSLIQDLCTKKLDPTGKPEVVSEGKAFALVNGNRGPGLVAAVFAVDLAVAKARTAGSAAVGVHNSGDPFMMGYYAGRIAEAGCVGLVLSDSPPIVRPEGGVEKLLGTNPLAIGVPTADDRPFIIDLATCAQSGSRVRQAGYHDEDLPQALALDMEGRPLRSAKEIAEQGAIGPLAGGKGFGLALFVAFLAGPLTGSATGGGLRSWHDPESVAVPPRGNLFMAIDPASFGEPAAFRRAVSRHLGEVKASKAGPGVSEIRYPGEAAFAERGRSVERGHVVMYEAVWQAAARVAADLGVEMPA